MSIGKEDNGSNRTFMELKFACALGASGASTCSNRTFMELKSSQRTIIFA